MKNFSQFFKSIEWNKISSSIRNKTKKDVENALLTNDFGLEEMKAILSPEALHYLEPLSQKAKKITRNRFGNIIHFYIPIYLSNLCSNHCTYCGFSIKNKIKRKILNLKEIIEECKFIKKNYIKNFLIVTGEHNKKVGIEYFIKCIPLIRKYCSSLSIEIQPMLTKEYKKLKILGIDSVLVYQETYNIDCYKKNHLKGQKKDFFWRLEAHDRIAQAGIDKIGLGVLMGLSNDWRTDCYIMANHLIYLRNNYWKSRYVVSFPRLRSCYGGFKSESYVNESQLLQVMCAFRLLAPEVEISLSTRESSFFRDNVIPIVVNTISAGSKTQPGGYSNKTSELKQFDISDNRTSQEIAKKLYKLGLQPIWKDWDFYLGRNIL
ncbi:2-iminoacetate synthase ThiH [Sodalis-like secondary symbiont of Drepanosiphum platanoidis]|uniref:2-iminoacetate synthase ThiH n=1 Tax=Sodalis-like secondary symbiont of Drepanosiphum platanoidis TaxID=2994493 RepID=UPI003463E123